MPSSGYAVGEYSSPRVEEIITNYRAWADRWAGWRQRKSEIRALASGQWGQVFPSDIDDVNLPMVGNLFRDTIEDGGRQFAEMLPLERRFPEGARGDKNAEEVEQVINGYTQGSGIFNYAELFGMDMIACGLTAIKVWPRYSRVKAEGGLFPRFRRLDPDFVLPDPTWQPDQPTERACVVYTESTARLQREYPEQIARLLAKITAPLTDTRIRQYGYDLEKLTEVAGPPAELTVIEWYSGEFIARCVYYESELGFEAELLTERTNETGICPVQLAHRATWAREPLGQLDDSKGVVRTENRYMRLLTDYFVEMVYGGKLVWNVKNPTDRGPGTRYFALGPDARMDAVTPEAPSFQAAQIIDRLDAEARTAMNNPHSREGDVNLNKATAAFLTRAQGKLVSSTRAHQRSFAVAKRYANEAALAQDEAWCNSRKVIVGISRGRRYRLTYTPRSVIRGDYSNVVSYGTSSGLDPATHGVLQLEKLQSKSLSLESFLENDPGTDDVPGELARLNEGAMRDSLLMGFQLPDTPLEQRLRAFKMFDEGKTLAEVAEALLAAQAPAALPGALAGGPAIGRPSGIPGAEVTQGPALPPLDMLRQVGPGPAPAGRRR